MHARPSDTGPHNTARCCKPTDGTIGRWRSTAPLQRFRMYEQLTCAVAMKWAFDGGDSKNFPHGSRAIANLPSRRRCGGCWTRVSGP